MDLFGLGSMFGAIGDATIGGLNYAEQKKQNQIDNEYREKAFQYQKDLQQQIFQREDNAVQRRVADLEKAGFNKLMATGQAANAGSAVGAYSGAGGQAAQLNAGIQQSIDSIYNALSTQQNISQSKTQQQLTEAQILGTQAGTKKVIKETQKLTNDTLKTDAERNKIISEMMKADAERLKTEQERQINMYNYQKSRGQGLRTTDGIPNNLTQTMWIGGSHLGN